MSDMQTVLTDTGPGACIKLFICGFFPGPYDKPHNYRNQDHRAENNPPNEPERCSKQAERKAHHSAKDAEQSENGDCADYYD